MKTQDAIEYFGTRKALAEAIGVDLSATHHWGEYVPELRQYQIELASGGKLKSSTPALRNSRKIA
jgi:transcriptional repressor of cell division inhibition gene dicB